MQVLMGGGHAFFTPTEEDGLRTDGRNIEKVIFDLWSRVWNKLFQEWQALPGRRTILRTVDDIHAHAVNNDDQVLG